MATQDSFDRRIRKISKSHKRARRRAMGPVTTFRPLRSEFPFMGLALAIFCFVLFKAVVLMHLGEGAYNSRVRSLGNGSTVEKLGAWVLQIDPATKAVASSISDILR